DRASNSSHVGYDDELIIVTRRGFVPAVRLDNRNETVVLNFHGLVVEAELTQQFHASNFKPHQKIGIIDDTHLVGFRIAHAKSNLTCHTTPAEIQFVHRYISLWVDGGLATFPGRP